MGVWGDVWDHAAVESVTYNPWTEGRLSTGGPVARQMRQHPSSAQLLRQALVQSVGDIGVDYRVPPEWLVPGVALVAVGALFTTLWSHVTVVEDVAVSMTPSGGVLASRSFGW